MSIREEMLIGFKMLKEFETKNLKKSLDDLMEFTDILIYFNEVLAENKIKNREWEKYYETVILKFSFHGVSLYRILDGYQFKSKYYKNAKIESVEVLDISSAKALLRAQFETFLMLHYIYINPKDDDEKALRYYAWVYSALLRRQEYTVIDSYGAEQKKKDLVNIQSYETKIKALKTFNKLSEKQQKQLLEKGNGKLFNNWSKIIEETGIKDESPFKFLYEYLSIYSHSEGLSVIQLKESKFIATHEHNQTQAHLDTNYSKILTSVLIKELVRRYQILIPEYEKLTKEIKFKIDLYSNIPKKKTSHNKA